MDDFRTGIRDVPGFPKPGIIFKDITPLLRDARRLRRVVDELALVFDPEPIDLVAAPEARGFILGSALAVRLDAGFVPIRKPGKLPHTTTRETYELEYGSDAVEVHSDAIGPGDRVLIVDDLLATGGTSTACAKLIERLGGEVVGFGFLVELGFLAGRERIAKYRCVSLLNYDSP